MFGFYTPFHKHLHELLFLFAFCWRVSVLFLWLEKEKTLLHVQFKTAFFPDWFCSQNKHIAAGGCESETQLKGEKSMIHFKEK